MRSSAAACAVVVLWFAAGIAACRTERPDPIAIKGAVLTVENQTEVEWRNVEIWVNDHYRVTKPRMPPGERFSVPLTAFVEGFGRRFDPRRQAVRGIEVTAEAHDPASSAGGWPIRLVWGTGRRR